MRGIQKIWDILHPGKTQAGTWDTNPNIRDVSRSPGNMGLLATLYRDSVKVLRCVTCNEILEIHVCFEHHNNLTYKSSDKLFI